MLVPLGFLGTFLLNNFLKETYSSRKLELENNIENLLNKNVDLGDYVGIRFLGFSLSNSKISDKKDIDSEIRAKNVYVGIMPLRSFLKRKWIVKISPKEAAINIDKDFFKREKSHEKDRNINKSKFKYDLNFQFDNYSNLNLKKSGLKTKVKGSVIYRPSTRKIIANIKSNFDEKGFLEIKFNTKLNQDFSSLEVFSKGLNLEGSEYNFINRKIEFRNGNFKSNFKLYKSSNQILCRGSFAFDNLDIKTDGFAENLSSDLTGIFCKDNILQGNSKNLNYGSLTSNFNLNVPLSKSSNNIYLEGSVGYKKRPNPDLKLTGNIPYWIDKRGINFGNIDSSFNLNRTQLANLNIFQKNGIDGFITAAGELKGKISDPEISINFDVTYPQYKGIRIRDTWEGVIENEKNEYFLNMKNKYYSTIPTFLSIDFDSRLQIDNLSFSRVFNSDKGNIKMFKENNSYIWRADNFPLDELELSINKNQFDRIEGIINGAGLIALDEPYLDGRIALSLGKYGNIKLANSLFDFSLKDNSFYIDSSLYPIDGGIIEVKYNSEKNNLINLDFNNISTSWTILTAVDILNFDNKKVIPTSKFNILDDLEINKKNSLKESIDFINKIKKNNNELGDKLNLQKYLNKFSSRYDAKLTIKGDNPSNYKLNAKINGYLNVSRDKNKNKKEEFSIDLEGGLLRGKGSLGIKKLPLSTANIFLNQPRDFIGGLDMNLFYDLDTKSFSSEISSNNSSIKNKKIVFDKGLIEFKNSIFDIDFSLLTNESTIPLIIKGEIPINKSENLDLRLSGDGKILELIENFTDELFTFKKGDLNLRMILKGTINKPILNGFIVIKDSEIDLYKNKIIDINSSIIFDFESLEIENLQAMSEDTGKFLVKGSMPFYQNKSKSGQINFQTNKFNVKTDNLNFLLDSDLDLSGSFENPELRGYLSLNNGFIKFNSNNQNNKLEKNIKRKEDKKDWEELYWNKDENIEIISNETILNKVLLGDNLPNYLDNLFFDNLKLKLGPEFKLQYSEIVEAYLETVFDLTLNGEVGKDLNAWGIIDIKKGRANLYTTPFKLDKYKNISDLATLEDIEILMQYLKNKKNYIAFLPSRGVVPYINFSLVSKVPDSIIPIRENNQDSNISSDIDAANTSSGFGSFGIGNSRLIKIEASYEGFLDQLSFEDENKRIQLRSTPSYNRSQIIGLIGGNSANLINRAFISQLNNAEAFNERFQLSLYPALIENNDSLSNIFSNENLDIENNGQSSSNEEFSSQAWVAEIGLDITDSINFAFQTVPGRDDVPPIGILTFQANPNLELLGSYDSDGDWKSQVQLFFRY
ncbi:hypothetical protein HA150_03090 [Prochlorococcus marinus XMU1414]|uniref:Translocation/assembly module TamB domain-containing protein n=1 Tax=Prochlorococcus marinus XMU1424 TaxID=2774497 RepID=A0A9D9BWF2_PROMR|nr:translocation/assembly module TamB domain-containing protein [Prochlorococcus marinus]MBO8227879.1 hypothetical protein [Prochlorococcus marinus XMU1414]MBW3045392.1 hypothetical protein [Prochlorococcus marinus str. MU1414]MCR8532341.1 translocation/assembly module TamB [Prochlorococcus marinus XMU1420]MCR8535869.1 translocation/assembly module TamB [Prochlorococcus marinus XMU1424]